MAGYFFRGEKLDVEELKKKPILPYEGMKFAEDYHFPRRFRNGMYHVHLAFICNRVRRCLPIESAFKSQRIPKPTYYEWKRFYNEESEKYKGTEFTTPLIMFFDAIYEAEASSEDALVDVMMSTAIDDGNTDSAKYLLDKRHKWKEVKGIEVDTDDDKSLEISITPMQDNFKENEEEE